MYTKLPEDTKPEIKATTGKEYSTMTEKTCAICATCVTCPNCGKQIDFHAGHIDNGRVFVCEKGKPLMREVGYHCRHCDSTIIFLKKCEPEGVGHD